MTGRLLTFTPKISRCDWQMAPVHRLLSVTARAQCSCSVLVLTARARPAAAGAHALPCHVCVQVGRPMEVLRMVFILQPCISMSIQGRIPKGGLPTSVSPAHGTPRAAGMVAAQQRAAHFSPIHLILPRLRTRLVAPRMLSVEDVGWLSAKLKMAVAQEDYATAALIKSQLHELGAMPPPPASPPPPPPRPPPLGLQPPLGPLACHDPLTISSEAAPAQGGAAVVAALEADGVVHVTSSITSGMATSLIDSIDDSLEAALRQTHSEPEFGTEWQTHFGNVLSRAHRHDLKLSPADKRVRVALAALLETFEPAITNRLGGDAQLYELGALISEPGASCQPVHPDTPIAEGKGTDEGPTVLTAFCALQDIDTAMGPTLFLPATHTAAAHSAFFTYDNFELAFGDSAADEDEEEETEEARTARVAAELEARQQQLASWPTWRAILRTGDVSLFDSRCLHAGEANISPRRRILFYCSFIKASHANSWSAQGTLLSSLRGKHELQEWREWAGPPTRSSLKSGPPTSSRHPSSVRRPPSRPAADLRVVPSPSSCRALQPVASRATVFAMCPSDNSIRGRSLDEARAANGRTHAEAISRSEVTYGPQCCSATAGTDQWTWDSYSFPETAHARSTIGIDADALQGFRQDELARVSTVPLVSRGECAAVIAEAEAVGAWESSGQIAHYARRAGSLTPVGDLPCTLEWLRDDLLANRLFPAIRSALPSLEQARLRLSDARLVKYNASAGQDSLGMHRDGPLVTATVALNPPTEYDGGGTLIEALIGQSLMDRRTASRRTSSAPTTITQTVEQSSDEEAAGASASLRVEAGHVILHPGAVRHGGLRIRSGVRYVLVCFIFDANVRLHHSTRRPLLIVTPF